MSDNDYTNAARDTEEQDLQTVNDAGSPAPRRLATAQAADNIYERLIDDDEDDAIRRCTLQGMIDGNAPYVQADLDELGLGHMCNVNFMSMRANLDSRAAAAHELFVEVPTLIECSPKYYVADDPDMYHYCAIISEEFTNTVHEWKEFHSSMDLVARESDAYGLGYVLFENEFDWRPKAFRRGNLLIDPKASVEVDDNEIYMVRDEYSAGFFFRLFDNEEASKKAGWKLGNVKHYLVKIFGNKEENGDPDDEFQQSPWESLQHRYRNNDPEIQSREVIEKMRIVHVLVREVYGDQGVSHYIMPEKSSEPMFLYEGLDKYEEMSHALWWLPYNYSDGYARAVRGVASHMAQHDDLSNRFLCRVFDAGFMSSSLLLQPQSQADLSRLQFINHGPYTILPAELQAIQSTFQPQIAPLIQLRGVSESVLQNNTGTHRQHSEVLEKEAQKTARQVMAETAKESRFEKAAIVHRYNRLDMLYREMFRRLTRPELTEGEAEYPGKQEAKDFFKRCKDRGVPAAFIRAWQKNFRVTATRAIGLGSVSVKYDITAQMLQVSGSFDEVGKRHALRDFVAARVGYQNVDKYVARIDRDTITSNETSIATLEDNDMAEGTPVPVGYDQNHKIHLDTHMARVAPVIQAVEMAQVQDPISAFQLMQLEIQHMGAHIQYISQDERRKEYLEQIAQFMQIATAATKKLEGMAQNLIRQQQQAQAQAQQQVADAQQVLADRELEAKMFEIQKKYELEVLKQESLNKARDDKTAVQMDIRQEQAAEDSRRKAQKQAADIEIDRAKAQADIAIKRARAE